MFLIHEGPRRHLGKIGKVDFAKLRDAERDIIHDWDWYSSRQIAEQNTPDQRILTDKIDTLATALAKALTATRAFRDVEGGWLARHEFRSVVNDLLREAEVESTYLTELIEALVPPLDRMATIVRVLQSTLARRLDNEKAHVHANPGLRADFYRSLHRTLSKHGLDTGVGVNSLIVELVLNLQGKASNYADPIERRRKDLAREIKLTVKPRKGG